MTRPIRTVLSRLRARFIREEDGVAAIEFAFIAPIMLVMYFGLAEMASAISVDRRVSHGTNVAGDLATQQPKMQSSDLEEILSATLRVVGAPDSTKVSVAVESFILDASGNPVSRGKVNLNPSAGNFTPFDASALDQKLLSQKSGIVVTRVSYVYTPLKLKFLDSDIKLQETFLLKPRRSDAVDLAEDAGGDLTCTATSYQDVTCSGAAAASGP